jgi:4-amino-4-deoxy-L-arabinose transferase-like glycosyltransferase
MNPACPTSRRWFTSPWLHRALIFALFFGALAPTLTWSEFAGGMENFNVESALETVRHGNWLIPTLADRVRLEKPPLVGWITAWGIMSSNSLAWGARWPSLLAACLMLVGVYDLGRILSDWRLGLCGALICGSTIMFLKFAREASYDIHLALWVTWTNVALAAAWRYGRRWPSCIAAGVCAGLAFQSKGPPAFLENIVPFAVFMSLLIARERRAGTPPVEWRPWLWPAIISSVIAISISLTWYVYALHLPGTLRIWWNEVSLHDEAIENRPGWWTYIVLFPMMVPWVIWFIVALVEYCKHHGRLYKSADPEIDAAYADDRRPQWLALLMAWLWIPILVLEFMPARRDRYILPMIGPAALLAADAILRHLPRWRRGNGTQRSLLVAHVALVAVLAIAFPLCTAYSVDVAAAAPHLAAIAGAHGIGPLLTASQDPWMSHAGGLVAATAAAIVLGGAIVLYRRTRHALTAATAALGVFAFIVFLHGNARTAVSQGKDLAGMILGRYPDAVVYNVYDADPHARIILPHDLLIYIGRDVPLLLDPGSLPPADHAQVLIYPPAPDSAILPTPPPGFTFLSLHRLNSAMYPVFVRPPQSSATRALPP